ncbi:MAG TPA: hypothetical protein VKJ07_16470, partial [Mycobacteriales bacterium]|nr:hypothetical protein [Mycobacteriales bacterium]
VDPQGQFNDRALTVRGGKGDDTIRGSNGNDIIRAGPGDDSIDGGRGADTEFLGPGNDSALWLPGEGSDVIEGAGGHDTLTFIGNGANENFALTANGSHAVLTRDVGTITMDTEGVEALNLATLGGTDTVNVGDLSGTHLRANNIDLSSAGAPDGQLDSVTVNGTNDGDHVLVAADGSAVQVDGLHTRTNITGSDSRDQLQVRTGAGDDSVDVSDAAAALIGVTVDLGTDQH